MSDVFVADGVTVDISATNALPRRFAEKLGRVPTLSIEIRGDQPVVESSDPWMGKTLTWTHSSTLYFSGVIRSRTPSRHDGIGWVTTYQALGIRDLLDKFPLTDKTSGLDVSPFNCSIEDLVNYNAARAGRTVGQQLTDILTSTANAANLTAYGLGNLTLSMGVYSLPAATIADLAALTIVPPRPCYWTGERFGCALDGGLAANAPNVRQWTQPDGTLRFLDLTTFHSNNHTLTMGSDPIEPVEISRDVSDCAQRIEIRGAPLAKLAIFKLSNGSLVENFAWGSLTNAQAKTIPTNWTPASFKGTSASQDTGSCTDSSTTTFVVTSSNTAAFWASNYWDQTGTGAKGTLNLHSSTVPGVTSIWSGRITTNTALVAAGTSTITIDVAAPATSYDSYTISGLTAGASNVYRKYQIADTTLWPLVVAQTTYPEPFVSAGGGAATLTSTAMGAVYWPQSGSSPPYNMFPLPFVVDLSGNVVFLAPTYVVANNSVPADVWAAIPMNVAQNVVFSPQNTGSPAITPAYSGDSHTIEGLTDTLVCTMSDWRDPGQVAQVQAFADDWLKSIHDGAREGTVIHHGFYALALTFGMSLDIAGLKDDGTADTTGYEAAHIPVVGVSVEFSQGASDYEFEIEISSRRAHYSAEIFLRPERRFQSVGLGAGSDVMVAGSSASYDRAQQHIAAVSAEASAPVTAANDYAAARTDTAMGRPSADGGSNDGGDEVQGQGEAGGEAEGGGGNGLAPSKESARLAEKRAEGQAKRDKADDERRARVQKGRDDQSAAFQKSGDAREPNVSPDQVAKKRSDRQARIDDRHAANRDGGDDDE